MFDSLEGWEKLALITIFMGSVVDIFQFTWIVKRWITTSKKALYNHVKKQILLEQLDNRNPTVEKNFPGISLEETDGRCIQETSAKKATQRD